MVCNSSKDFIVCHIFQLGVGTVESATLDVICRVVHCISWCNAPTNEKGNTMLTFIQSSNVIDENCEHTTKGNFHAEIPWLQQFFVL